MLLHDTPFYNTLEKNFRTYAECIALGDTGYFKKRGEIPVDVPKQHQSGGTTDDSITKRAEANMDEERRYESQSETNTPMELKDRLGELIRLSKTLLRLLSDPRRLRSILHSDNSS